MIVTVCRRCTERHIGCHGTCERYLEQRAEMDRIRAEQRKKELVREAIISRVIEASDKSKKKKNKRWSK